jgi:hypothetical protein
MQVSRQSAIQQQRIRRQVQKSDFSRFSAC